jgi:hypothetical protein
MSVATAAARVFRNGHRGLSEIRIVKTLPPRVDDEQRVTRLEHGNAKVDHTQMDHTAADLRGEDGMSAAAGAA